MKKLLLCLCLMATVFTVKAQTLTVNGSVPSNKDTVYIGTKYSDLVLTGSAFATIDYVNAIENVFSFPYYTQREVKINKYKKLIVKWYNKDGSMINKIVVYLTY